MTSQRFSLLTLSPLSPCSPFTPWGPVSPTGPKSPWQTHTKGKTYTNTHYSTLRLTFYGSDWLWRTIALPSSDVLTWGLLTLAPFFPVGPIICLNEINAELWSPRVMVLLKMWEVVLTPLAGSPGGPRGPSSPFNPSGPISPCKKGGRKTENKS